MPNYSFFFLGKILERGVTNVGTLPALVNAGFADDGVVLVNISTSSKEWKTAGFISYRKEDPTCFFK